MTKHNMQILCFVIIDDVTTSSYNDVTTIQNVQVPYIVYAFRPTGTFTQDPL